MFTRTLRSKLLCLLTFIVLFGPAVLAQSSTAGDIAGTVKDPTGAVIANATVNLKSLDTGAAQSVKSSGTGDYRFRLLSPGHYQVSVEHSGFQKLDQRVEVAVGTLVTLDLKLKL